MLSLEGFISSVESTVLLFEYCLGTLGEFLFSATEILIFVQLFQVSRTLCPPRVMLHQPCLGLRRTLEFLISSGG